MCVCVWVRMARSGLPFVKNVRTAEFNARRGAEELLLWGVKGFHGIETRGWMGAWDNFWIRPDEISLTHRRIRA